ncbi:rRNA pseudouridine synthase [bacterium]|nr:rRNA pseudouridine synthase [bacterium]
MQKERIQKVLARAGIASRRKVEWYMVQGLVAVNGKVVTRLGETIDPETDKVTVNGHEVSLFSEKKYLLFYKPRLVISSCYDEQKRQTVMDYFSDVHTRLYPVGRLDYDSDGLLILTNDGDFTYALTHPKHEVMKTYLVHIQEEISRSEISLLERGLLLDGYQTKPCQIHQVRFERTGSWIEVTLHEGRNRQIRKMLETIQKHVLSLTRIQIGPCTIGRLKPGEYRSLTQEEIRYFQFSHDEKKKEKP